MDEPKARRGYIDVSRGLLMSHMALDHVSLFFNPGRFDHEYWRKVPPAPVSLAQFLTRFSGVPVAPAFSFMAGFMIAVTSASRSDRGMSEGAITRRLLVRGLILILAEMVLFGLPTLQIRFEVLSCLGVSMMILALVRRASQSVIFVAALAILALHPLLPPIPVLYSIGKGVLYPVIPWVGFMLLGYGVGRAPHGRFWGVAAIASAAAFLVVRLGRGYGNAYPYDRVFSYSFFTWSKYPPDLAWIAWSLAWIFAGLAILRWWNPSSAPFRFVSVFGRVPLFFYIVHFLLLGGLGIFLLRGLMLPLWGIYLAWAGLLLLLWRPCRAYFAYKEKHPTSIWRYL